MKRIAVIGSAGQLGSDLLPLLGSAGIGFGHDQIELGSPESIADALSAGSWSAVINCAAYNLVDRAENEPEAAFAVNAFGVRHLAAWCGAHDVPLMQISTDYVFGADAARELPYREIDVPGPVSVYGTSKLTGEMFVHALCPRYWVVRTCGLYGRRAARGKGNFVETMLRLANERPELRIVADQHCTPTSTSDLAQMLVELVRTSDYGLYHATNSGSCSWYEFAAEIFRLRGISTPVIPITAAEFGAKARRPDYSVLDCRLLSSVTGITPRSWQEALRDYCA